MANAYFEVTTALGGWGATTVGIITNYSDMISVNQKVFLQRAIANHS
ncbi:hypothetical protein [Nostoc sp. WHI]|nr:hypothetical protein [Nostoc sp. WHI]